MAEKEASDSAAAVEEAAQAGDAGAAAKPVRKGRVARPEKPSRDVLNKEVGEVNDQISDCQKRIQEIKDSIDNQRQGKHGYEKEIQDAKRQLAATIAQFRATMDQKKALRDQLAASDEARKRLRDEAKSLRDRLQFVQVEQIDEEIKKLEYRMAHTSLTLNEEKRLVQQVKELGKSKEFVKDYTERIDRIAADEHSRSEFLNKIKEKDERMNALKAQEQQQKGAIDALWAKSRASTTDIPTLIEEREKLYAQVKMHREKIKQLHGDFREKENSFWEMEKEWRAQQAEDRKKAYEEREAYRKEKEARRKAWEAENFVEPYTDEIIICDQLVSYVQKLGLPAAGEGDGEGQNDPDKKPVTTEGFGQMVVAKKNRGDEELDSWFGGMGKGKKKKGASRQRDRGERFLTHSLDAITSFGKIKATPPTTTSEEAIKETVEIIKEKKAEYLKLQAAEREKRAAAEAAKESGNDRKEGKDKPQEAVPSDAKVEDSESQVNGEIEGAEEEKLTEEPQGNGEEGEEEDAKEAGEGDTGKVEDVITKVEKPEEGVVEEVDKLEESNKVGEALEEA